MVVLSKPSTNRAPNFLNQRIKRYPSSIQIENRWGLLLLPEHEAQIHNYLKATGISVGLLIKFGNPKLDYTTNS
ncbi:MAG: hypothetical protein HOI66_15840 [Verrucomicrobia bacterium]|nr:hypothetical protein [Verrucomicrobiota bacterium]